MATDIKDVKFGLWIDDPKRDVLTQGYFRTLNDHGIDVISVMIDPSDKAWNPNWSEGDITKLLKLADQHEKEVVLTTWPYPCREQLDQMATDVFRFIGLGLVAAWEVDVEFNWKRRRVEGFRNLDEAGDFLVEVMDEACSVHRCRKELTTFTEHVENGRAADVAPHMNRLTVQAYSVAKRGVRIVSFTSKNGPGRMQRRTMGKTLQIPGVSDGSIEVGLGLAAWSQRFNGCRPEQAMQIAVDAALEHDIKELRWWSSKHVLGNRRNPYAGSFIRSLRSES